MKREILFRHPENAELEWTGYGRQPKWVEHFIQNGGTMEQLSVFANKNATVTKNYAVVPGLTQDLPGIPPAPKKRGRPSTGKALSAAERKRRSRLASYDTFANDCTSGNLSGYSNSDLAEKLVVFLKPEFAGSSIPSILAAEFVRRGALQKAAL